MEYPILRNLPLSTDPKSIKKTIYPWDELGVGDAFVVIKPCNVSTLRTAANQAGKSRSKRFGVYEKSDRVIVQRRQDP